MRYLIETDQGNLDEANAACLPYEISYEIITHPAGRTISPARKYFANSCRQRFWLKMQG
ncbi:MAG: hypothetical protein Q4G28_02660 [Neisseria sp.]|nr:hypothetical protein [Neisseria sp.]